LARGIPYRIVAKYPDGKVKATRDTDRKPIVLARVRRYLTTGQAGRATCIPANVVRDGNPPARPGPRDRLYYRWYAKEFWMRGEAPTFEEFARAWTKAKADQHLLLMPQYAYLTDLRHQRAGGGWKALRRAKAKPALKTLARIAPARAAGGG
jgi:hypothetical protein